MKPLYSETFQVAAEDFVMAGEASAKIKYILKMGGIPAPIARRATVACYEAEMNIIIHSKGGAIRFAISPERISLVCEDSGPGITDIDAAMREGYSTASEDVRAMGFGAGMGLPNIRRNSNHFRIESSPDGTTLDLGFDLDLGEVL